MEMKDLLSDFLSQSSENNWDTHRGVQPMEICHYTMIHISF